MEIHGLRSFTEHIGKGKISWNAFRVVCASAFEQANQIITVHKNQLNHMYPIWMLESRSADLHQWALETPLWQQLTVSNFWYKNGNCFESMIDLSLRTCVNVFLPHACCCKLQPNWGDTYKHMAGTTAFHGSDDFHFAWKLRWKQRRLSFRPSPRPLYHQLNPSFTAVGCSESYFLPVRHARSNRIVQGDLHQGSRANALCPLGASPCKWRKAQEAAAFSFSASSSRASWAFRVKKVGKLLFALFADINIFD